MRLWAAWRGARPTPDAVCGACCHFCNDPLWLEQSSPGLAALSSAFGAVRADDGVCSVQARYVSIGASCERFAQRAGAPT
jgi:hypothetical protein